MGQGRTPVPPPRLAETRAGRAGTNLPAADPGDAPAPSAGQRDRDRPGRAATEAAAPGGRRPGPATHRPRGGRQGRRGPRSAPRGGGRGCPERAAPPGGKAAAATERGEPTPRGGLRWRARAAPGRAAEAEEGARAGPALPPGSGRSCLARGSGAPEPALDAAARRGEAAAPPGPAPSCAPCRHWPSGRPPEGPAPPAPVAANRSRPASERARQHPHWLSFSPRWPAFRFLLVSEVRNLPL